MGVKILVAIAALVTAAGAAYRLLMLRREALAAGSQLDTNLRSRREQVARWLGIIADSAVEREELCGLTAALRQAVDARGIPARAEAENELMYALRLSSTAAGEAPGAAASPRMRALCEELAAAGEQMALAAQSYNRQVMAWNRKIHQLPWSWIAALCRFQPIEYFVLDDPVVTGGHERRARCWSSE